MNRTIIAALVAATALTATAADARTSARQRGVPSGAEAKERMTTRDLNAQQLSGGTQTAMAPGGGETPGMAAPTAAAPATDSNMQAPAPETSSTPMTPTTETTPAGPPADSTVPAPDAAAPPR